MTDQTDTSHDTAPHDTADGRAAGTIRFPARIEGLPPFEGPFDAYRLAAEGCEVLFASYPAGTRIGAHDHPTENVGVITAGRLALTVGDETASYGPGEWYHVPAGVEHSAAFDEDTAEIEFWFTPLSGR